MRNATRRVDPILVEGTFASQEMASLLDITKSYLRELTRSRVLPYAQNADRETVIGRYNGSETVKAYIRFLKNRTKAPKSSSAAEFDAARTLRMTEAAKTAIIKNAIIVGTVYRAKDVDQILSEKIVATKSRLLAFPAQLLRMTEELDLNEKIKMGQKMIEECLVDLSVPDSETIRSRDRKLTEFGDVFATDGDTEEEERKKRGRPRKEEIAFT
jgi:hypothetical protein